MYTKQEMSRQKQAFWTAFGKYMKPVLSAEGEEVSWVNYRTGVRGIGFRMEADQRQASIAIELSSSDADERRRFYDRLVQLRGVLTEALGEGDWDWLAEIRDEHGKVVSRIGKQLSGVSVFRQGDWPAIISFLKPRIIALDEFWGMVKDGFNM